MILRVLLTAGPTREPLDPVRFLSNASSGRQAVALAEEALSRKWHVDFVHGPLAVEIPDGVVRHPVLTAAEMLAACRELHPKCDVLIGAAAVSDYRAAEPASRKRKRAPGAWVLRLVPTEDILATLGRNKGHRLHVGFALETDHLLENARKKLQEKNLDCIIANPAEAIGRESGTYHLLGTGDTVQDLGPLSKRELARIICDEVEKRIRYRPPAS